MKTKIVEFNFPGRKELARLDIGNGNWIDVYAVETGLMRERYWQLMYGGKKISQNGVEVEPGAGLRARFITRVANWNLEIGGETIPFNAQRPLDSLEQIPWSLVVEIEEFCNEIDASYKKEQGTDDPQN